MKSQAIAVSLIVLLLAGGAARAGPSEAPLKWHARQPVPFEAYEALRRSLDAPFPPADGDPVSSPDDLRAALARAEPGDRIRVASGTHEDWGRFDIDRGGTAAAPVVIGPARPHAVTFTGDVCFTVRAPHVVLHGFDFVEANGRGSRFKWAIVCLEGGPGLGRARFGRVSGCRFISCGWAVPGRPPGEEAGSKYLIQSGAADTRVDHCYVYDRQGTAVNYAATEDIKRQDLAALYLADHNVFRDSSRLYARGRKGEGRINREAISIWGGHPHQAVVFLRLLADANLFDREVGDDNVREIMTVKASGTVWRHNVFANGPGGISFRCGRSSTACGNVLAGCDFDHPYEAHQVCGAHHLFVNNYLIDNRKGLALAMGDVTGVVPHKKTSSTFLVCERVERCVFAHNAFLGNGPMGLGISPYAWAKRERAPLAPTDNVICNNLFVQQTGVMLDLKGAGGNRVHHNWFAGDAGPGDAGEAARRGDPGLTDDRLPGLRPGSPARTAGAVDPGLPANFYGNEPPEQVPVGPIATGPYGFDGARIPHVPPPKEVRQGRPLRAAVACLPRRQTAGRYVVLDGEISDGWPVRFQWDFGDGTRLTETRGVVPHLYHRPGRYTVTLTVTDADGGRDTVRTAVEVGVE
jgi:hypothetical protein